MFTASEGLDWGYVLAATLIFLSGYCRRTDTKNSAGRSRTGLSVAELPICIDTGVTIRSSAVGSGMEMVLDADPCLMQFVWEGQLFTQLALTTSPVTLLLALSILPSLRSMAELSCSSCRLSSEISISIPLLNIANTITSPVSLW